MPPLPERKDSETGREILERTRQIVNAFHTSRYGKGRLWSVRKEVNEE